MSVSYEIIIINSLFQIGWIQVALVADSSHREKTFIIEKSLSESRKKFWNPEKYFRVKKNYEIEKEITESRKKIKIKKNISESTKKFRFEKIDSCNKVFLDSEIFFSILK